MSKRTDAQENKYMVVNRMEIVLGNKCEFERERMSIWQI